MSYPSKPPELLTFFIDRCLGKKIIANALREKGVSVEVHDDHFPQNAKDEEWLSVVGDKEWVIFTKDKRIKYNSVEKLAVRKANAMVFTLATKNLQGSEMADLIIKALPKIEKFTAKHKPPFIAKITRSRTVSMMEDFKN